MTAVWFGCSNAARELVKERAIYLRERMVNLSIVPYVLSKVVVLAAFAFIQCVLLLFILDPWFGVPGLHGPAAGRDAARVAGRHPPRAGPLRAGRAAPTAR